MKKFIDISVSIYPVKIIFCPNKEEYRKYIKKYYRWAKECRDFTTSASTACIKEDYQLNLIVGIQDIENIYEAKALIVHELSHCVTETFEHLGIKCDEARSYMLQRLYIDTMTYFDKYIEKKSK